MLRFCKFSHRHWEQTQQVKVKDLCRLLHIFWQPFPSSTLLKIYQFITSKQINTHYKTVILSNNKREILNAFSGVLSHLIVCQGNCSVFQVFATNWCDTLREEKKMNNWAGIISCFFTTWSNTISGTCQQPMFSFACEACQQFGEEFRFCIAIRGQTFNKIPVHQHI